MPLQCLNSGISMGEFQHIHLMQKFIQTKLKLLNVQSVGSWIKDIIYYSWANKWEKKISKPE